MPATELACSEIPFNSSPSFTFQKTKIKSNLKTKENKATKRAELGKFRESKHYLPMLHFSYNVDLTFSLTVPDTSETFCVATSDNFFPASDIFPVNLEAPNAKADQLYFSEINN